jgi:outer membrane protein assembly factor BamB
VLGATAGALAAGTLPARGAAQQASGPTVYVGSADAALYAVDAATGTEEWAFTQPSEEVFSSPTVVSDPESGDSVGSRVMLGTLHWAITGTGPIG